MNEDIDVVAERQFRLDALLIAELPMAQDGTIAFDRGVHAECTKRTQSVRLYCDSCLRSPHGQDQELT